MNWVEAESSFINQIAYEDGKLYVKFKGGDVVIYSDVPEKTYKDFLKSASKGKFFMAAIKERFPEQKMAL